MDSTASNPDSKEYAYLAGQRAIEAHYQRLGIQAEVERITHEAYQTHYKLTEEPRVSVIIPNKDHVKDLECCISSMVEKTAYKNIEYLIVENNSEEAETFLCYERIKEKYKEKEIKILHWQSGFNYSMWMKPYGEIVIFESAAGVLVQERPNCI